MNGGAEADEDEEDVRGGDKSSGEGLGLAILDVGREEDGSRVRFFTEDESARGGERSKVGESSFEVDARRGGVKIEAVAEEAVEGAVGVDVEEVEEGGRSMRGRLRLSEGSIGIISFKFLVAAARVLSSTGAGGAAAKAIRASFFFSRTNSLSSGGYSCHSGSTSWNISFLGYHKPGGWVYFAKPGSS